MPGVIPTTHHALALPARPPLLQFAEQGGPLPVVSETPPVSLNLPKPSEPVVHSEVPNLLKPADLPPISSPGDAFTRQANSDASLPSPQTLMPWLFQPRLPGGINLQALSPQRLAQNLNPQQLMPQQLINNIKNVDPDKVMHHVEHNRELLPVMLPGAESYIPALGLGYTGYEVFKAAKHTYDKHKDDDPYTRKVKTAQKAGEVLTYHLIGTVGVPFWLGSKVHHHVQERLEHLPDRFPYKLIFKPLRKRIIPFGMAAMLIMPLMHYIHKAMHILIDWTYKPLVERKYPPHWDDVAKAISKAQVKTQGLLVRLGLRQPKPVEEAAPFIRRLPLQSLTLRPPDTFQGMFN